MVNCRGAGDPVPDLWQPPKAAAITAFYAIPRENLTCERVAEVLQRFSLGEWDQDDPQTLADACVECGVWDQHEGLIHAYFMYDPTLKLFTTNDAVLVYDDEQGLVIRSLV